MTAKKSPRVGIDDMALYTPSLYLPIEVLAEKRGIPYPKLNKGLGLEKMAIPDVHEDAATMAANAVAELIERNQIHPDNLGRIYLGTESALDGAKPTATYLLEMLRQKYRSVYGEECFRNCDVVDLTFACIGGVDALQNTLDWVRGDENRQGIVVCSDFAKYELASTGEYTQGAGAVAMLVKHNPRLLSIEDTFGIATLGVHDFFKPKQSVDKKQIIAEVLKLAGVDHISAEEVLANLPNSLEVNGILDENDSKLSMQKDTPIFDGPYSNQTYQNRIREAFQDFKAKKGVEYNSDEENTLFDQWERIIFHLPYAAHGRRIASELFMLEVKAKGNWETFAAQTEIVEPNKADFDTQEDFEKAYAQFLRAVTKTDTYKAFVSRKLAKGELASSQIGNMYACSVFLALMSTLEADYLLDELNPGDRFGFFAYGSGSKSKVFEATVQEGWKEVCANFQIQQKLDARTAIDYETYEALHKLEQKESVIPPTSEFSLVEISTKELRKGARYYKWSELAASYID